MLNGDMFEADGGKQGSDDDGRPKQDAIDHRCRARHLHRGT